MVYSVWSHGRLLGVTDLGFKYRPPRFRAGWFHPADDTESLMDMATGLGPALHACRKAGGDMLTDADLQTAIADAKSLALELRDATGKIIETGHIAIVDGDRLPSIDECEDLDEKPDWITGDGPPDWLPDDEEEDIALDHLEEWELEIVKALSEPEGNWMSDAKDEEPWSEGSDLPRYQISVLFVHGVAAA
jgi:hypothetical protein